MRLMHLSDLHLGKIVNGFSMLEDQEYILKQILEIAREREVQAVLLCGDIYDRTVPPEEAVHLFDWFLTALAERNIPVFIISGNHDSARRLAFGAHLMENRRIYLAGVLDGTPQPIVLTDDYGEIAFYLLPFVKPVHVRNAYRNSGRKEMEEWESVAEDQESESRLKRLPVSLLMEDSEEVVRSEAGQGSAKQPQDADADEEKAAGDTAAVSEAEDIAEESVRENAEILNHDYTEESIEQGDPDDLPDPETLRTYQDAISYVIGQMQVDESRRNIILAHQFVTGAVRSESETVNVGGTDNIDAALFEQFDYAALGHIHRPQQVGREQVRYCGTPLKYSFSEAGQEKSVTIVDMREKGTVEIDTVPLHPLRDMREIRGSYEELTLRSNYIDTNTEDYLHVTLTDEEDIVDVMNKLRTIYPNIMKLDYDNLRTSESAHIEAGEEMQQKSALDLIRDFYQMQNNQEMNEQQSAYIEKLLEDA